MKSVRKAIVTTPTTAVITLCATPIAGRVIPSTPPAPCSLIASRIRSTMW
jgi:hypothetical protein